MNGIFLFEKIFRNVTALKVFASKFAGNIETIYLRSLLINLLKKLIDSLKYVECIHLMKRHRIDMNLLYDHNPEVFFVKFFLHR